MLNRAGTDALRAMAPRKVASAVCPSAWKVEVLSDRQCSGQPPGALPCEPGSIVCRVRRTI